MAPKAEKRQKVYKFIQSSLLKGVCPSFPEIQKHFKLKSVNGVAKHVEALVATGQLERTEGTRRSLRLPGEFQVAIPLQSLGSIIAGRPERAETELNNGRTSDIRSFGIPADGRTFELVVRGDSMQDAGILDGDSIVLKHGIDPEHGDVVAALIDREDTLKIFVREKNKCFLKAANSKYPDLIPTEELTITGVMVGLIRASRKAPQFKRKR
ncbi:MAG: transcriptional repressor LexA [Verrucomicrobiota bacterium]